jgi:hypothetical protein
LGGTGSFGKPTTVTAFDGKSEYGGAEAPCF